MNRIEQMTGHSVEVQSAVEADLIAETRGPGAFERALAAAPRDELLRRYAAALARINQPAAMHDHTAGYRTGAALQHAENAHARRGGN